MNNSKLLVIGRALIASLFIPSGISKLLGFAGTVGYVASAGLPFPALGAAAAVVVELVFGLALLFGFKTRIVSLVIAAFTLAAGFAFHQFWSAPAEMAQMQQIQFMKNIAIAGGLLVLAAVSGKKQQ